MYDVAETIPGVTITTQTDNRGIPLDKCAQRPGGRRRPLAVDQRCPDNAWPALTPQTTDSLAISLRAYVTDPQVKPRSPRKPSEAFLSSGAAHDEVMATRDRRYPDLRRLVGCVAGFVSVSGCSFRPAIGNSSSP